MDDLETSRAAQDSGVSSGSREVIRQFVEHWGMMARAWGINPTMGELFALLYITGTDWTAEELKDWLRVSRGNVSMNLRELLAWGVVRKLHRPGERRELFRAETDVWTLFRRILKERKRRELDPTLTVLDRIFQLSETDPETARSQGAGRIAPPVLRADRRPREPAAVAGRGRDGRPRPILRGVPGGARPGREIGRLIPKSPSVRCRVPD